MKNETIEILQQQLRDLERRHTNLEVTVKTWNDERRALDEKIRAAENEMLQIRVKAWRQTKEVAEQLNLQL